MDFTRIKNLVKKNGDKFILIENGEPEMVILPFSEYEKMTREDMDDIRWDSDEKQAVEDDLDFSPAGEIPEERMNNTNAKTDDTLNDFISEVYKNNAFDGEKPVFKTEFARETSSDNQKINDFKDLRGVMEERSEKDPADGGKDKEDGEKSYGSVFQRSPLDIEEETDFRSENVRLEDLPL